MKIDKQNERIREALLKMVRDTPNAECEKIYNVSKEDTIAWLEKQGEQKPQVYKTEEGEIITYSETDGYKVVEPKFHRGQWIACKGLNTALIVNIEDDKYEVEFFDGNKGFPHIDYVDRFFHLWTIQDAKDGDVLFYRGNVKYSDGIKFDRILLLKNLDKSFFVLTEYSNGVKDYGINENIDYTDNIIPATKEQRDLLFAKMKEAGYEWDAEKKELRNK